MALHGHRHSKAIPVALNAPEKVIEAPLVMGDRELLQQLSLGGRYPHVVFSPAYIDSYTYLGSHRCLLAE